MTNKNSTTQKKQKTKDLRKNIRKEAKKFCGQKILHAVFRHGVSISNRNIKEILNQPHKHFDKKKPGYIGTGQTFPTVHLFRKFEKTTSWRLFHIFSVQNYYRK